MNTISKYENLFTFPKWTDIIEKSNALIDMEQIKKKTRYFSHKTECITLFTGE